MPIRLNRTSGTVGFIYENVFVGPTDHTVAIAVNLAALTSAEIDANGYLKPGIPLSVTGGLVTAGYVFGVTVEEVKVADNNATATISALGTQDIAVATIGMVNRKVAQDILGRAYTAAEAAGFNLAGSKLVLIPFVS
jgi:hypothetical protein